MFIDALGWEVVKKYNFASDLLPVRHSAEMQFGYSSAAIPTILTGATPEAHGHMNFYYYSPKKSPFKFFRLLGLHLLPKALTGRWRFRHLLSRIVKKFYGYTGYFELYSMPFNKLPYFDYSEKKDLFISGGIGGVKNLADFFTERKIPHHISNWRLSEEENISALKTDVQKGEIEFAFLYTAAMDALLHDQTKDGEKIIRKLEWYESQIREILGLCSKQYKNVIFNVISDHGMTTHTSSIDLISPIENLPLTFGKDYVAAYDSTMARFWYLNDEAKELIQAECTKAGNGHFLSNDEKKRWGINFEDHKYGDDFFLCAPGVQIVPSDMGPEAVPGMHGYSPDDPDSDAAFLSNCEPAEKPTWVGDFFRVMTEPFKDQSQPK